MYPLRLHDPARRPPEWMAHLSAAQVVVFCNDVKSHATLDPEGNRPAPGAPAVCYVFDSLAEAERFCEERVGRIEHLMCEVYDRRGKIYPLRSFVHSHHAHRIPNRASARRMIAIAWLLIAITPLMFWIDYRHEGTLIVPTVVGFACLMTGLRLLYWAYGELEHVKQNEEKT